MSGFPPAVRALVIARAGSRCERCGVYAYGGSIHHRRPRGMGGDKRPEASTAANALLLCGSGTTGCHGWVESHRVESRELGLLLFRTENPADVPVTLERGRVILAADGTYQEAA